MKTNKYFLLAFSHLLAIILGFSIGNRVFSPNVTLPKSSNLISLNSKKGEKMLTGSSSNKDYLPLSTHFITQNKLSYCGVATMAITLNALRISAPTSPELNNAHVFTQDNVLNNKTKKIISNLKINFLGITLEQLSQLFETYSVNSHIYYAESTTLNEFRKLVSLNLGQSNNFVVVNYSRKMLGQKGLGHISPVAAYNSQTDSFLILDVARYKYPPVWVKAEDLWQAMNTQDSESKKTRGFILLEKKN